jgi:signal transduction histidine kinase
MDSLSKKVIIWNQAMERMTGFKNMDQYIKINPETITRLERVTTRAARNNGETIYNEVRIKNSDHQPQWLGITYSFIKNSATGNIGYMISVIRDITKEKAMDDRNKEFIYTTTHELRTPITAIKGYLSMILNGDAGTIDPKQRLYFNRVFQSTERLVLLVEGILNTARIESGHIVVTPKQFDVGPLIHEVMSDFKQKSEQKNIIIKTKVENGGTVWADYDLTKQALSNLVDNAIKYTPKGEISISSRKKNGEVFITVSDTGVGIPKKELDLIFTKFYRVENSESVKAGGTGLGLFIVKNLIEKQGGRIDIESRLRKGTDISIIFTINKFEENK